MIFSYNKAHIGDVLLVSVADDKGQENQIERKKNIVRVFLAETGQTVAWNIFNVSSILGEIEENGQVMPTNAQIEKLNQAMASAGFAETVTADEEPKFVVGFVRSCKKHPDSDHLAITQTEIDRGQVVQIVCGAPNIKAGQKVVVAKPGAMMPDGLIIWPGVLRGVASAGMICSAKELHVANAPEKKGILELPFDAQIGTPFEVGK